MDQEGELERVEDREYWEKQRCLVEDAAVVGRDVVGIKVDSFEYYNNDV